MILDLMIAQEEKNILNLCVYNEENRFTKNIE